MLMQGKYIAQVDTWKFGKSANKGTQQIELEFLVPAESERIRHYLYFTDASWTYSVDALKICGWDGVDFGAMTGLGSTEVEIVVVEDEYEGKIKYKVKYINEVGGSMSPAMEETEAQSFIAKMNARVKSLGGKPATPGSKAAAVTKQAQQKQAPKTPTGTEDDIPF